MPGTGFQIKNIVAVVAGIISGSICNMALVSIGPHIISPPVGSDVTTIEGLKSTIHLFEPRHFIFTFLAHAIGSLVGAWIAARFCNSRPLACALCTGGIFLIAGTFMAYQLPQALIFNITDLVFAYVPMSLLGYSFSRR